MASPAWGLPGDHTAAAILPRVRARLVAPGASHESTIKKISFCVFDSTFGRCFEYLFKVSPEGTTGSAAFA